MSEPFIAEIRIFPYTFAPRGWAFCDGTILPIVQNTALFSLIGTTYGGDGRNTFALPNLNDRVPMHPGRGQGLTSRRLGENTGSLTIPLSEAQIPSHTHNLYVTKNNPDSIEPFGKYPAKHQDEGRANMYKDNPLLNAQMNPTALSNSGESLGHENTQPYNTFHFCIALVGLYPSRS